jgi:hypothetical protein
MDFASELLSGKPVEKEKEGPASTVDFAADLLGGDTQRQGQWMRTMTGKVPFERTSEAAASPSTAFVAGIPTDKMAAIRVFAKERGIPVSRYKVINGEIVYQADDGKYYAEVPGLTYAPATSAAYVTPDVLEAVPGVAAGVATSPMLMTGPVGFAGSTAITGSIDAASNALRQKIAEIFTGQKFDIGESVKTGVISSVAQAVPFGAGKIIERNIAKDINRLDPVATQNLRNLSNQYGITLTPAELTNLSSLKAQQKILGNIEPSGDTMMDFYRRRQTEQISPAVESFLSRISPVDEASEAGSRVQKALNKRRDDLIKQRDDAASPFYTEAFKNQKPVNVTSIISELNKDIDVAKGTEQALLKRIKKNLFRETQEFDELGNPIMYKTGEPAKITKAENRLDALQSAKIDIDAMFKDEAFSSLDKRTQAKLANYQTKLVNAMGKDNPSYIKANKEFEKLSAPINEFDTRKTGVSLMRVSQDNVNQMASRIFEGASPDSIRFVKSQIEAADPQAWQDISRAWLQNTWTKAQKPAAGATEMKIDAGLSWKNMLFGEGKKSEELMRAALTKDQYSALRDLSSVLEAAGRVKKIGSDTAFNALALEEMKKSSPGILPKLAKLAGAVRIDRPLEPVAEWLEKQAFSKNADSIARMITDPNGIEKIRELKRMSVTTPKYWAGLSQLVADYSMSGGEFKPQE